MTWHPIYGIAIWLVGALASWRSVFRFISEDQMLEPDDAEEFWLFAVASLMLGLFWPLFVPVAVFRYTLAGSVKRWLLHGPVDRDLQALQERIRELEEELDIGA